MEHLFWLHPNHDSQKSHYDTPALDVIDHDSQHITTTDIVVKAVSRSMWKGTERNPWDLVPLDAGGLGRGLWARAKVADW